MGRSHNLGRKLAGAALLVAALVASAPAAAETRFWVGARGDYFSGSSDLFTEYDNPFGGGIDLGLAFGKFAMTFEALIMGQGQYLFDFNLGAEWLFDEGVRWQVGLFTGPMLFLFPEDDSTSVDLTVLSPSDQEELLDAAGFDSIDEAEAEFEAELEQADELSQLAVGWNLVRLRLGADVPLGPMFFGLAGQLGYHLILEGEEVAAGIKNQALDDYAEQYGLPDDLTEDVANAIGAHAVDRSALDGLNWDVYLYARFEL